MPELPQLLTEQLGVHDAALVLDRRGSMIWDITTAQGRHALKPGYPIAETEHWPGQPWTALAPARESAVLEHRGRPIPSGEWGGGSPCPWSATGVAAGCSTVEALRPGPGLPQPQGVGPAQQRARVPARCRAR